MKNNIVLTLLMATLSFACNPDEWLDETPMDVNQITTDFKDNIIFDDFTRSAYFNLKSPGTYGLIDLGINRTVMSDVADQFPFTTDLSYDFAYFRNTDVNDKQATSWPLDGGFVSLQSANRVIQFYENNEPFEDSYKPFVPHIRGECYFLRAFVHFNMALIWAPPYSSDPQAPGIIIRTRVSSGATDYKARSRNQKVYDQIISDLEMAISLLPDQYEPSMPEDYQDRAKKGAAQMLLAKVYFIMGEPFWDKALVLINDVINSGLYPLAATGDLGSIFSKSGLGQKLPETIFYTAYYYRNAWRTPRYERHFSKLTNNQARGYPFSKSILQKIGWDDPINAALDARYTNWCTRYEDGEDPTYPDTYNGDYYVWMTKFQPPTANFVLLRSAELYLMRANIEFVTGSQTQALDDINLLRNRAGLPDLVTVSMDEIEGEWIKEMAFEGGSRMFFLQANQMDIPAGDRQGVSAIPYDDPSMVFVYPENETSRNPLANKVEG